MVHRVRRVFTAILDALSVEETGPEQAADRKPSASGHPAPPAPGRPGIIQAEVVQAVWGKGFYMPGGAGHALRLARSFAPDSRVELVYIGSGLGGDAVAVSERFGCRATVLESVPELEEIVRRNIDMSEVRAKIRVQGFDPAALALKAGSVECVLSHEFLFRTAHKARILRVIGRAMRAHGQLSLTDFMLAGGKPPSPALRQWVEGEPSPVYLWTPERYEQEIGNLGLEVRISEDIGEEYYAHIMRAFRAFKERYEQSGTGDFGDRPPVLLDEIERWGRLAALIASGEVRLHRYFALKPPGA